MNITSNGLTEEASTAISLVIGVLGISCLFCFCAAGKKKQNI